MENEKDEITAPSHYKGRGSAPIEVIDVIENFQLGYHLGNVVKYVLRAGYKGSMAQEVIDLKKARQFLNRKINLLEGKREW